jgi:hypothetical protein
MLVCVRFKIIFEALILYCNIYYRYIFDHRYTQKDLDS